MKRRRIRHITAKNARELQDRLNEEGVRKEHIIQVIYNGNSYVAIYEK